MAEFILMNKNTPVVSVCVNKDSNKISSITEKCNVAYLPVGVSINGIIHTENLNSWWKSRSIPASREFLKEGLSCLGLDNNNVSSLISRCFGLSLSDQYWLKPKDSNLSWDKINFFTNPFSDDIGTALFDNQYVDNPNFQSPDNTSDGMLKKKWKIINGKRCLLKAGSGVIQQESFNEKIASIICKKLGIRNYVNYDLKLTDEDAIAICENFVTPDTELISAYYVMQTQKRDNKTSNFNHYVKCCSELGVDIANSLDNQIVLDYLMCNTDRHYGNFGIIRDVNNLSFIGAAPLFDNGTSLYYNRTSDYISKSDLSLCKSKPFKHLQEEQLSLLSNSDFININQLTECTDEIYEVLGNNSFIDDKRKSTLITLIDCRIQMLDKALCKGYTNGIDDLDLTHSNNLHK